MDSAEMLFNLIQETNRHWYHRMLTAPLPKYPDRPPPTLEEIAQQKTKEQEQVRQQSFHSEILEPLEKQLCQLYHTNNIDGCPICHECEGDYW